MTDSRINVTGFNTNESGDQTLIVKYKNYSSKFDVNVIDKLDEIEIDETPKTEYCIGDKLDYSKVRIDDSHIRRIDSQYCNVEVTIKNNNSLQLKLKIKKLKTKEMKVTSMVNLNYEKGYFEKAIDISPKSVTISGAEDDVNEVDKVVLIGEENHINKSFSNKYKLMQK